MEGLQNKFFHMLEHAHRQFHRTEAVGITVSSYGGITHHPLAWVYMGAVVADRAGHLVNDALHPKTEHVESQQKNDMEVAGQKKLESVSDTTPEHEHRPVQQEKPAEQEHLEEQQQKRQQQLSQYM